MAFKSKFSFTRNSIMHHYSYSLHHLVVTVRAAYHTRFAAHCFFFAANCLTQICSWNRTCLFTCTIYDYGVAPMTPHHNANIMHNQEATWRNSEFFPSPHEFQTVWGVRVKNLARNRRQEERRRKKMHIQTVADGSMILPNTDEDHIPESIRVYQHST